MKMASKEFTIVSNKVNWSWIAAFRNPNIVASSLMIIYQKAWSITFINIIDNFDMRIISRTHERFHDAVN